MEGYIEQALQVSMILKNNKEGLNRLLALAMLSNSLTALVFQVNVSFSFLYIRLLPNDIYFVENKSHRPKI